MKRLGSLGLSILLMMVVVILGLRFLLLTILLNEGFYHELQQEVKLADKVLECVTVDLKTLMKQNNLPETLVDDLIPISDIEEVIQLQTKETIELLKGNQETMTLLDPEPYIWELEPRILNYLTEEGYEVLESGYEDLMKINDSIYQLTRGDIHLFDITTLMYSGTVEAISSLVQLIIGPLPICLGMMLIGSIFMIWKKEIGQSVYWISSSLLSAGLFGLVMLSQIKEQTVGISTNLAFNEAITKVISIISNVGGRISLVFLMIAIIVYIVLFCYKMSKLLNSNL